MNFSCLFSFISLFRLMLRILTHLVHFLERRKEGICILVEYSKRAFYRCMEKYYLEKYSYFVTVNVDHIYYYQIRILLSHQTAAVHRLFARPTATFHCILCWNTARSCCQNRKLFFLKLYAVGTLTILDAQHLPPQGAVL